jgi:hypothetical protein
MAGGRYFRRHGWLCIMSIRARSITNRIYLGLGMSIDQRVKYEL